MVEFGNLTLSLFLDEFNGLHNVASSHFVSPETVAQIGNVRKSAPVEYVLSVNNT